jgi:hypothetical protein
MDMLATTQAPLAEQRRAYRWYALAILIGIYILASLDRSTVSVVAEALKREFRLARSPIG